MNSRARAYDRMMQQDKRNALLADGEVGAGRWSLSRVQQHCGVALIQRGRDQTDLYSINTQVHSKEANEHSSKWRGKGNKQLPERSALCHGANENGRSRSKFLPKLGP